MILLFLIMYVLDVENMNLLFVMLIWLLLKFIVYRLFFIDVMIFCGFLLLFSM